MYIFYICIFSIYIYIKQNAHNDGNRAQPLKTLLLAVKKCTGFTAEVIWVNTKVCSVASEPTQSSSRHVSFLMLLLRVGSLVTLHTLVFTHITSVVKPVDFFMARNRVFKNRFKGWALFPSLCAFCLCSDIYIDIYISFCMESKNLSSKWISCIVKADILSKVIHDT